MTDLRAALLDLIAAQEMSISELARRASVSRPHLSAWIGGRKKNIHLAAAERLFAAAGAPLRPETPLTRR